MKKLLFTVLGVSLLIAGCGSFTGAGLSGISEPPKASVVIAGQHIQTVVNGYQWSDGNHTSVADAASDPARNLTKYSASPGQEVTIVFERKPKSTQLSSWSNGIRMSPLHLKTPSFTLPTKAGDYTYEITGQWGDDYVNYDFEVVVH